MNLLRQQRIITTAVFRNVMPCSSENFYLSMVAVFLRMLVTAGNHLPTSQRIIAEAAVLTLTALNSNFTKQQGHAETYVTTGDEIKEYDLGGMWYAWGKGEISTKF